MRKIMTFLKRPSIVYFVASIIILTVCSGVLLAVLGTTAQSNMGTKIAICIPYPVISFLYGRYGTKFFPKITTIAQAYAPHFWILMCTLLVCGLGSAVPEKYQPELLRLAYEFLEIIGVPIPIVQLLGMLCFALGERRAVRLNSMERKGMTKRSIAVLSSCLAVLAVIWGGAYYHRRLTTLELTAREKDKYLGRHIVHGDSGYGFPYENGWSSVDLRPYYVENAENELAKLGEPSDFVISQKSDMPVLDGAEAAYPVYSAFANACYDGIAEIQNHAKENDLPDRPIQFTNTVEAYKGLVSGDVDIFFGAKPSKAQLALAEEAGVELVLTPIGKEAFVFFVSEENPVTALSSEQIRNIYSGKITNWISLGGKLQPILAFQRPENSGSQTMMQYFMGDVPLKAPLEVEFEYSMIGVIREVADYQNRANAIGYSFRYYASQMVFEESSGGVRFLELDGVFPDAENIRNGSYPMTTELYAITLKENPNPNVPLFVEWMTGEQGQELVQKTGYIANRE